MEKFLVPAKVNLTLKITGKRGNMHTLDMEVCSVDLYDEISWSAAEKFEIDVNCPYDGFDKDKFLDGIFAVKEKFENRYGCVCAKINILKNIPFSAGLGGSTASAIGVIKAFEKIKNVRVDDGFLQEIGSDAPYMYRGGRARVQGIGEIVQRKAEETLYFVILVAKGGVDSGKAYSAYDEFGGFDDAENDLEKSAFALNPQVRRAKEKLLSVGCKRVVMTGSGSGVVGIFDDEREAKTFYDALDDSRGDFCKFLQKSVKWDF